MYLISIHVAKYIPNDKCTAIKTTGASVTTTALRKSHSLTHTHTHTHTHIPNDKCTAIKTTGASVTTTALLPNLSTARPKKGERTAEMV
jgi:hypothetical protein